MKNQAQSFKHLQKYMNLKRRKMQVINTNHNLIRSKFIEFFFNKNGHYTLKKKKINIYYRSLPSPAQHVWKDKRHKKKEASFAGQWG